ncbi:hypothetical protein CFC21_020829 [Triticum aestivum]|uniref:UDP-glycosyltransferases domain-containing protein n=2 Tax=Triticum aestivum TaxID=4565 RepID=A0A9R1J6K9_WHEAT|nr:hypothetical protein CFC21_020829 [Triticum aestivum]
MFARCCAESMLGNHNPDDDEGDPDAVFSVAGLPHRVELRRSQMMTRPDQLAFVKGIYAADQKSYGELVNSFHELETDYVEHYRTTLRRRAWLVGPVALASGSKDEASRGTDTLSPDADGCIPWLDAKPARSVVFVAFGTLTRFSPEQLQELARGLKLSGKDFVWVISDADAASSDIPEGFPTASRGYIIRGWAPQVLILNHTAVGGFVTHCGWNSTLEAVSAGVPMVTWPRHADQFFNEKLVVDVLAVGVSVGAKDYGSSAETHRVIGAEVIAGVVRTLMEVQGDAMRSRARDLGLKARSAVDRRAVMLDSWWTSSWPAGVGNRVVDCDWIVTAR